MAKNTCGTTFDTVSKEHSASSLKMEAADSSETVAAIYYTTWCHTPETIILTFSPVTASDLVTKESVVPSHLCKVNS
jgi:hypothetical protein